MFESFVSAVERIPGFDLRRRHAALRSAKLLRRRLEAGERLTEAEWLEMFPAGAVCQLARIHLDEGPGAPAFDPDATDSGLLFSEARPSG